MKIEYKESELSKEKKNKVLLLSLSGVLLAVVLMQSITVGALLHYAHSKHDIRFIPPKISQEFTLSQTGVSDGYLRDMSHFLTQLRFNVTASSAALQFNVFLGYVSASLYGDIRAQLVKEVEQITHEHLSSVFYPTNYDIDNKHLSVKVAGLMKRFVGAEMMSEQRETFLIQYSYDSGQLKITNLSKVSK
ncbi:type IV conjugative transfer system protein TraE [uncultured Legionella sp.]|uniref:type IV conjugative transfer system protein TraE n=1 Tax=uncultured Legionella sp. TaxID=210934 RepID=UPI0026076ABE|nr:type IV conjugative transfer system protein TraE [uncultured Legionella sp.]